MTDAIPGRTRCPDCGAEPTDESIARQHLSDLGYDHEDVSLECSECDRLWVCGVPEGVGTKLADDLWCESCDSAWMRVHRVRPKVEDGAVERVGLDLKCPNHGRPTCDECDERLDRKGPLFRTDGTIACSVCGETITRDDLDGCYNYEQTSRTLGPEGSSLVGWPMITGSINPESPYGFAELSDD